MKKPYFKGRQQSKKQERILLLFCMSAFFSCFDFLILKNWLIKILKITGGGEVEYKYFKDSIGAIFRVPVYAERYEPSEDRWVKCLVEIPKFEELEKYGMEEIQKDNLPD